MINGCCHLADGHTITLEFIYDEIGRPIQLIWDDGHGGTPTVFNYVLNQQGDVQQIRNAQTGAVVATYLYNAWGQLLYSSGWMANHNPLRYRGKYYDVFLGMYYLQSRYYDPTIGRFINADAFISTGQGFLGWNMFTYCLNNPVMLSDHSGYWGCSSHLTVPRSQITGGATSFHVTSSGQQAPSGRATTWTQPAAVIRQGQRRNNTSSQAAATAAYHTGSAWFRGAPVRRSPPGFGAMAIGGTIWLPEHEDRGWVVLHEWGHLVDERILGPKVYFSKVGVPSTFSVLWDRHVREPLGFSRVHHTRSFEVRANHNAANFDTLPPWPHQRWYASHQQRWSWDWHGSWDR